MNCSRYLIHISENDFVLSILSTDLAADLSVFIIINCFFVIIVFSGSATDIFILLHHKHN